NFRTIENGVMQRNREHAKPERSGPFEELMRGIIERVLRIVERVDVEIDLDPIVIALICVRLHLGNLWIATREATVKADFASALALARSGSPFDYEHEQEQEQGSGRQTRNLRGTINHLPFTIHTLGW